MRCRQCGGENLERARYCRFCGAELAYKGGGKKQNKKSLVIRVSLICLAFVFCAVGITSFTLSKKTEKPCTILQKWYIIIPCFTNRLIFLIKNVL